MPSSAITVILNANHAKRFACLLRSHSALTDWDKPAHKESILREARNKFRLKNLTTVYLQGGTAVQSDEDLTVVGEVYIAKSEPYAGPPPASSSTTTIGSVAPVNIIAEKSFIDDKAIKQLDTIAALTGMRSVVGLPDLHPGARFPIGCAFTCEGVYPALIGSDIGCGIALYRLAPKNKRRGKNWDAPKLAKMLVGLDGPWAGDSDAWLWRYGLENREEWEDSLGTVGAGNHFAEICMVETIVDQGAAAQLGLEEGALLLLVHSGSRGLGASILDGQTTENSNPYIPPDSPSLPAYLKDHDYAVRWAEANRDLIAHRIKQCVFPPPSAAFSSSDEDDQSEIGDGATEEDEQLEKIIDVTHNSVTRLSTPEGEQLWVHRKGAAPTDKGITPCPGSRGDFSWLLRPLGDGTINAHSLAHGAGRRYGRMALHSASFKAGNVHALPTSRAALTTTALGSEVVCTDPDLLVEERPEAYKDVACVVEDLEAAEVARGAIALMPIVTYKVREAGERR